MARAISVLTIVKLKDHKNITAQKVQPVELSGVLSVEAYLGP